MQAQITAWGFLEVPRTLISSCPFREAAAQATAGRIVLIHSWHFDPLSALIAHGRFLGVCRLVQGQDPTS